MRTRKRATYMGYAASALLLIGAAAVAAEHLPNTVSNLAEATKSVTDPEGVPAVRVSTRFESARDGVATSALGGRRLADRDVIINGRSAFRYTTGKRTFLVLLLQGGDLTVTIDGKAVKHEPGDTWVVPASTTVTFATGNDTASVNWVEVEERR